MEERHGIFKTKDAELADTPERKQEDTMVGHRKLSEGRAKELEGCLISKMSPEGPRITSERIWYSGRPEYKIKERKRENWSRQRFPEEDLNKIKRRTEYFSLFQAVF